MATSTFSVRCRPVKIGFLVRDQNIEDITKASKINTLLWGGIYNPLIPVSKDFKFSRQLIKLFNVDVLFGVNKSEEIETLIKEYEYLESPHFLNKEIFYEDWRSKKQVVGYLDVANIIDFYWNTEFKNKPKNYKSNCALVKWNKDDCYANLFSIIFGEYPDDLNLKHDYRTAFSKGLKARNIVLEDGENIDKNLNRVIYPLALTRDRLESYSIGFRWDGIFVGQSDSFDDLLSFWNLRASGLDLLFMPLNSKRFVQIIQGHLSEIDKRPSQHANINDYICVYSRVVDEVESQLVGFKTTKRIVYSRANKIIGSALHTKSFAHYFGSKQVLGNINYKFDKYSVSIALPEKPFKDLSSDGESQDYAVVIDPITEFEYPEHTLKIPFIPELNEFYGRQIFFDPSALRVDDEGIALIKKISDSVVNLSPIPNTKLIEKLFEYVGIPISTSPAGRLTYQIIQQMREYDSLEACRVFKILGVRQLIKSLTCNKSIKWNDALKTIGSNNFEKYKRLFIEPRNELELTPHDVWIYLLKKRVFIPYLHKNSRVPKKKKSFGCRRCGLKSNITYKAFTKGWICGFCKYEHYMPEFIGDEFNYKAEMENWRFKKSGLFSKDNNQEGAIPVILTLIPIKRRYIGSNFIYSTSLEKKSSKKEFEIDFTVFNFRRTNEIEIGIGECKSDFGRIDTKDIDTLKKIKNLFDAKGFTCYLMFSKTADSFTEEEITLFKKLKAENILPILFTSSELESYGPNIYRDTQLPRPYATSFEGMALNSEYIYLRK